MKIFVLFFVLVLVGGGVLATDVQVPPDKADSLESWNPPVDSLLNAGDTVRFINEKGKPVNITKVGLFTEDGGYLFYKTLSSTKWDSMFIVPGGFHSNIYVNKISPKSKGLNLRVKYK